MGKRKVRPWEAKGLLETPIPKSALAEGRHSRIGLGQSPSSQPSFWGRGSHRPEWGDWIVQRRKHKKKVWEGLQQVAKSELSLIRTTPDSWGVVDEGRKKKGESLPLDQNSLGIQP